MGFKPGDRVLVDSLEIADWSFSQRWNPSPSPTSYKSIQRPGRIIKTYVLDGTLVLQIKDDKDGLNHAYRLDSNLVHPA